MLFEEVFSTKRWVCEMRLELQIVYKRKFWLTLDFNSYVSIAYPFHLEGKVFTTVFTSVFTTL